MRGVKAKRLRKEARERSMGVMPERDRNVMISRDEPLPVEWKVVSVGRNGYVNYKANPMCRIISSKTGINNKGTVRGIYRELKKGAA